MTLRLDSLLVILMLIALAIFAVYTLLQARP